MIELITAYDLPAERSDWQAQRILEMYITFASGPACVAALARAMVISGDPSLRIPESRIRDQVGPLHEDMAARHRMFLKAMQMLPRVRDTAHISQGAHELFGGIMLGVYDIANQQRDPRHYVTHFLSDVIVGTRPSPAVTQSRITRLTF